MHEIRWHGRGGQGGFTVARLLGMAASVFEGKFSVAFPTFGPDRRGSAVLGFTRISETRITDRSMMDQCDYVVVLDETLMGPAVLKGVRENGVVLLNTKVPEKYRALTDRKIVDIDATSLAIEILGRPITNTAMLGALLAVSGVVSLFSVKEAIKQGMQASIAERNCAVVERAYEMVKGE